MQNLLQTLLLIVAGTWLLIAVMLFVFQRQLLYFPTPVIEHRFEEIRLQSDAETLRVITVNPGQQQAVLYFGGNGEAVAWTAEEAAVALRHQTLYFMNYRGYGGSTGRPTESGLYRDSLNLYDSLRDRHDQVSVIGRSLGSGVATHVAANRPVHRLVLVTPFDSVVNVAQSLYPIFPAKMILRDHHNSVERVPEIDSPTLILQASDDDVIPARFTGQLVEAFPPAQIRLRVLPGGHNSLSGHPDYYGEIARFLDTRFAEHPLP